MIPKETSGSLPEDWARRVRRAKVRVGVIAFVWVVLTWGLVPRIFTDARDRTYFGSLFDLAIRDPVTLQVGVAVSPSGLRYELAQRQFGNAGDVFATISLHPFASRWGIWVPHRSVWSATSCGRVLVHTALPSGVTPAGIRAGLADYLEQLPRDEWPVRFARQDAMAFLRSGQTWTREWLWKGLVVDGVMLLYSGVVVWSIGAWMWAAVRRRRAVRRWNLGLCTGCGYNIQGSVDVGVCPECGCRFASGSGEGEGSGSGSVASGGADTIAR